MNLNLPLGIAIHPIVLLSIVDHYERSVGNKKNKRVMGVLLGIVPPEILKKLFR